MSKKILFLDEYDNTILYSELTELKLNDGYVLDQAIKKFRDPEPCIIHRTIIMQKFYIEFDDFLNNFKDMNKNNEFLWSKIPKDINEAIDLNELPFKFIVKG